MWQATICVARWIGINQELWDPGMQRLTLLLDPGRIKRGVGPNLEAGLALERGEVDVGSDPLYPPLFVKRRSDLQRPG